MKAVVERRRLLWYFRGMKWYQVYLIQNEAGRRYIGLSENVIMRLQDHNSGRSKYTAKFGPWRITWTSKPMNLSDARKLENLLKKQKGGKGLETLLDQHAGS
jgi:putative endonuclease